ncbi:MAG: hypothetical protein LCH81_20310 [Bacteroidetes bacterium]|nr:hypothetical protein [Bacteroidota bacterium]
MEHTFLNRLNDIFNNHGIEDGLEMEIANRGLRVSQVTPGKTILFIGHNPSFRIGDQPGGECLYCPIINDSYFSHYFKFAESIQQQDNWNYLDLFYYRHTEQAFTGSDSGWVSFLCRQLIVTQDIIESLQPKIIVICNTAAAKYTGLHASPDRSHGVWMGYKFEWDDNLGADRIKGVESSLGRVPELKTTKLMNVPVLFSGFNQYKSVHDRKRLEWHIRYVIRNGIE